MPAQVTASLTTVGKVEHGDSDVPVVVENVQVLVESDVALFVHVCIIASDGQDVNRFSSYLLQSFSEFPETLIGPVIDYSPYTAYRPVAQSP